MPSQDDPRRVARRPRPRRRLRPRHPGRPLGHDRLSVALSASPSSTPRAPSCSGAARSSPTPSSGGTSRCVLRRHGSLLRVLAEVALHVLAVVTTGYWESPFVFSLLTAITVAGFARGFGFARAHRRGRRRSRSSHPRSARERLRHDDLRRRPVDGDLLLVALVAGYARRISGEADRQHSLALDRLGRLADANTLLFSLHRVTQSLPASLDLDEVLDTTIAGCGTCSTSTPRSSCSSTTPTRWEVVRRQAPACPSHRRRRAAAAAAGALLERQLVSVPDAPAAGPGLAPRDVLGPVRLCRPAGRSSACSPSSTSEPTTSPTATSSCSEASSSRRAGHRQRPLVRPAAHRRRRRGAHPHRPRPARPHRPVAGLPGLRARPHRARADENGEALAESLEQLRDDVRGRHPRGPRHAVRPAHRRVREQDMAAILDATSTGCASAAGSRSTLAQRRDGRLPILQEREMWRIAQEALANVERHAEARRLEVRGGATAPAPRSRSPTTARASPSAQAGRLDSYGILGMRERAASIGATLEIDQPTARGHRALPAPGRVPHTRPSDRRVHGAVARRRRSSIRRDAMTIRLMLADDHRMLREGLRRSMTEQGFDVVGEAADGAEAVRLCADAAARRHPDGRHDAGDGRRRGDPPDPGRPTRRPGRHAHHARRRGVLASAIRAGASGYLVKDCSTEEIAEAVRMAAGGETALSPQLAASMLDEVRKLDAADTAEERAGRHPAGGRGPPADRRRLLDPRGGRAALHQPEDGQEPPGVDLPEARRP